MFEDVFNKFGLKIFDLKRYKYLVIDCESSLIFIELKENFRIQDLINEIEGYFNQRILRIFLSNERLSNW